MKTFKIEVQEFLSRIVEVEANSKDEAVSLVRKLYQNQEIVLDDSDFIHNEIDVIFEE